MSFSKNAFNCYRCPKKSGDDGCPMWWETLHTNVATSEEKWLKSCGYEQLPMFLIEVIKASNRPAAAVEGIRGDVERGLLSLAQAMPAALLMRR